MTDVTDFAKELIQQKTKPAMPIAPIHRLLKHLSGLNVTKKAPKELQEIYVELTAEIVELVVDICTMMKRKTIDKEMIRIAYNLIRKKK